MVKFILVFLVLLMVIGINLPEGMMSGFGYDPGWLAAALVAWVLTALVAHRRMALIVLVVTLAVFANSPVDIGLDRHIIMATLLAVAVSPLVVSWFE